MKRSIAAIWAVFCCLAPAQAAECRPMEQALERIAARGERAIVVTGSQAIGRAVDLYNAIPGEQLSGIDAIIVASHGSRGGAILFGRAGRFCRVLTVPQPTWRDVREAVLGMEV